MPARAFFFVVVVSRFFKKVMVLHWGRNEGAAGNVEARNWLASVVGPDYISSTASSHAFCFISTSSHERAVVHGLCKLLAH
jgi:hypothetical protein